MICYILALPSLSMKEETVFDPLPSIMRLTKVRFVNFQLEQVLGAKNAQ